MAREAKIQIFQGTTPKPTRDYLQLLFEDLRRRYQRLVVSCAGRFMVPQIARAAGWSASQIRASDVSLFSSVVGYVVSGRPLDELELRFSAPLEFLEEYRDTERFAAAVLYGMKWAQFRAGQTYYMQQFREELEWDPAGYIGELHRKLVLLSASVGKIDFAVADPLQEAEAVRESHDTAIHLTLAQSPKFDPIDQHVYWKFPVFPLHDTRILDYAMTAGPLVIWARTSKDLASEEAGLVVFGHELKANQVEYVLASAPAYWGATGVSGRL